MAARREERPSRAFRRTRRYREGAAAVGKEVRALRKAAGWTLERAAERMGLDFRHLQQIEAGTINLTLITVLRIADAFGVSPQLILPISARSSDRKGTNPEYGARGSGSGVRRFVTLRAETPAKPRRGRVDAYLPNPPPEPTTSEAVQKQVGQAVARFRRASSLTQAGLAAALKVSVQYVQKVEAGKQNLTIATLVRFANALGVEPETLITFGKAS